MIFLDGRQASHAAAGNNTDPTAILLIDFKPTVLDSHNRRSKTILNKEIEMFGRLFIKEILHIEILYFSSNLHLKVTGIKTGNKDHTTLTRTDITPGLGNTGSQRCYQTDTCNHNSALHSRISFNLYFCSTDGFEMSPLQGYFSFFT